MNKVSKLIAILLAILFIATACSNGNAEKKEKDKDNKDTVIYNDKVNKDVEIPKHPKRVIDMNFKNVGNLLLLGQEPVGVQEWIKWNPELEKEMKDIPKVDLDNIESVAKQKPDLILANASDKNIKKYQKLAPTIVYDSKADYKDILKVQAKVLNKEQKGKEILKNWDEKIEKDKKDLGSKINHKTITVVQDYQKEQMVLGSGLGRSTEIVYGAYGMKPSKKVEKTFNEKNANYYTLSKERIDDIDGDYIAMILFDGNKSEIFNLTEWENLNAVKNNHVLKLSINDASLGDFKTLDKTREKIKKQFENMQ